MMEVRVNYYGLIADKVGCAEELVELESDQEINFRTFFEQKYPQLSNQTYRIAINQMITDTAESDTEIEEIVLFPPYAGG